MAKRKFRTQKNTVKIVDFLQEVKLSEGQFFGIVKELNIRLTEGQKNIDSQEAASIRGYLNEQKRRAELRSQTISLPSIVNVQILAQKLELPVGEVLAALLKNGVMANLNDDLDFETAAIIAEELGYQTEEAVEELEKDVLTPEALEEILKKEDPKKQEQRPPVVTILGHVDHGKTSLLDAIRTANVAAGEAGGITQAISSYQVEHNGRGITFIDTPGHETFDFMRQRGAKLADIAILVVAADDGVKPQTKDAIEYIKNENIPVVVAINKVDKEGANVEKTKKDLAEHDLAPEEWGGNTTMVEVSALKKQGIDDLLEMVLLTSDLDKPKADASRAAIGTVIESRLDKNMGPLASILVHTGTLKPGDDVVAGRVHGRVRRLLNWQSKDIKAADPSTPVTIIGLKDVPQAGDIMQVVDEKDVAADKATQRRAPIKKLAKADDTDERGSLALVLKADSKGSLEALEQTIEAMAPDEVRISIIRSDVGNISDSDVLTAQAAGAIVYGFNVKPAGLSQKLADKEGVSIRLFNVIYQLSDDVRKEIEERLPMEIQREDVGRIKVLKVFFSTQKKKIVGGEVAEGVVSIGTKITILRGSGKDREEIGHGEIIEMEKEKTSVSQGEVGDQIGFTIEGKGKIKEGDVLAVFEETKVRKDFSADANEQEAATSK